MYLNNFGASNNLITAITGQECSFKINYGETKDYCINSFVRSPSFMCSGYEWCIRYYPRPRGSHGGESNSEHVGIYFELESPAQNVSASMAFRLISEDLRSSQPRQLWSFFPYKRSIQGFRTFIKRSLLESEFVRDGCFVLSCDIRVLNGEWERTSLPDDIPAPPVPYLQYDLYEFLKRHEMTDIFIDIEGVIWPAHRLILAARSPYFKELFTTLPPGVSTLKINYMSPAVFNVVLHFMYTDTLLPVQLLFDVNSSAKDVDLYKLIERVLMVASGFKLDHLKLICEEKLAKHISMETVVSSLELAHSLDCRHLKEVCFQFGSKPENINEFMQSDVYAQLMQRYPELLAEYQARNTDFPPSQNQRTE
ncbi:BTB-POZ and MATH domain 2 [Rhynchospora pubera]|uniref:BTB-POZ and MATH domain 2 n=1 Tax=Rhynchospora pubera TaxID=906938 RepID=A0AAV8HPZ8_9POAL|nr:BTB-POZ and MATH domain 2 [Rhynchospora pubera]KAJ4817418.1 BTB-POZ and MATH domain 2 [Rhynchospora pubera]